MNPLDFACDALPSATQVPCFYAKSAPATDMRLARCGRGNTRVRRELMERSIRWILLGARSGIGQAVLRSCRESGLTPLIGASDTASVRLAERHGLPLRAFDLGDEERVARQLMGIDLVVRVGGLELPGLERLGRACVRQGCALIDLSDQMPEHLALLRHGEMLESRGIPWVVSAGAASASASLVSAHLHDLLPEATALTLTTEGPDPRLAGIDLRWWRSGGRRDGWRVRAGVLEGGVDASDETRGGVLAYPWRADLADRRHREGGLDVDTLVCLPYALRSPRLRRALADRPQAASRLEHCVHRFGPPGLRRLTASGCIRGGQGQEKRAAIAIRDALEVQARIVRGLLLEYRNGGLPAGAHTPLSALGPKLARLVGLERATAL